MKPSSSISPAASSSRAFHTMVPEPVRSPLCQPLSIGPTDKAIAGIFTVAAAMRAGGGGLCATDRQHHTIERITIQHFDQTEIGEIAVESCGGALAGFLNGMDGKFDGNTT